MLDILSIDWSESVQLESNDANHSFDKFYNTMSRCIDKHMPLRKMTKQEYKQKFKPWVTNEILRKLKQMNNLIRIYIKLQNHERKNDIHLQCKRLRNDILEMIRTSRKNFYKKYFESNKKSEENMTKRNIKQT